jgi:predicted TIM-barrel fold metal-dependent hydrolase
MTDPPDTERPLFIDTDVHNAVPDLLPYLPRAWHAHWRTLGLGGSTNYFNPRGVARRDVTPPNGGAPASDPLFLISDHLDRYGIDYAILTGPSVLPPATDRDYSTAVARAFNDAMAEHWLSVSSRFRASILINGHDPAEAAKEIRRIAGHDGFVQVIMAAQTRVPLGQRDYYPIYEAACEFGLPVAVHPGTEGAGASWPPTPVGYPSRYMEWHNILPIGYMAQINSLVTEGVFVQFPELIFVAIEGGLAWLPHLMWRMDKNFKALRDTTPWLTELPSSYIKDHVVLTTQPIEEPDRPEYLEQLLTMMSADRTVMFSSDYPHWDNDNPEVMLHRLDPALRARIFGGRAMEVYGLTERPPREELPAWSEDQHSSVPPELLGQVE